MASLPEITERIKKTKQSWLVTGCAGFIGSHLVEFLLRSNQRVVGVDNFLTGSRENISYLQSLPNSEAFSFIEGDITNFELCEKATKGIDFVLHQAALGSVPRSVKAPLPSHDNNVTGTINVFHAAIENKVKKLVFASSSSVYGDDPNLPKVEEQIGKVLSPYAATKKICEVYAEAFSQVYDFKFVGLRYFNVFGPRQNPQGPYAAVIPLWISKLLANESTFINGDGKTSRDFTFIDNVIAVNILSAISDSESSNNIILNVACGKGVDLTSLHSSIKTHLETIKEIKIEDKLEFRDFRAGDIRHSLANIEKAKNAIGYKPLVNIDDGLRKTVEWYLNQT
ncbi:MAG: SDR family oxidoreductase [Bdellovibrionales bacterium]